MARPKKPTISVALATHNGARFLREQLESIKRQTLLPTEIVVSDDNSQDQTLEVVADVLNNDWCARNKVTLRVLRNPTALGPGPNFEQALTGCTGDYVVLCDQDDEWKPRKLETLESVLSADTSALLVHSDARLVDADGKPLGMTLSQGIGISEEEKRILASGRSLSVFVKRNLATGATMMIRRELIGQAFPLPRQELHDGWLALAAALQDGVRFVPEELIDYRMHEKNHIGAKPVSMKRALQELLSERGLLVLRLKTQNNHLGWLLLRLGSHVSEENKTIVANRIAHNHWRISLPFSRMFRVWPVIGGVLTGRYRKYGRQPHDVLRDLIMPPEEHLLRFLRGNRSFGQ